MDSVTNVGSKHSGHLPASGHALTISAWLTGIYFVLELAIGLWTGSIAVISDAFHTFSAVGGVLVAIVASRIAKRPASEKLTFGWYRAEIIGALVNGAFLFVMAIIVIAMGTMRLNDPIELATGPMLLAAAGGLLTEFISLYLLYRQQKNDLNIKGAYWHILQTFVGSLIIIVAALVVKYTGFLAIDPLLGAAFGFVLLWASWRIMREAIHLLMDGTPEDIDLTEVAVTLSSIEGVKDVHHIHGWALTSDKFVFSAHIRVEPKSSDDVSRILRQAHQQLKKKFGFFFVTLQVETECFDETAFQAINVVFPESGDHSEKEIGHAHGME